MKRILICILLAFSALTVKAQLGSSFENIIAAGENDASVLMKEYMRPAMEGLIFAQNGGWYHTAKTHSKLGFDISIGVNASMVPSEKEIFSISSLQSQFENTVVGTPDATPTVAGDTNPSTITFTDPDTGQSIQFDMPEGVKDDLPLNAVPAPVIQGSVGLFFDTDVILRYVPEVGSDEVKGDLFGIGLKHNLMQYFGPLDKLPLNISILGGYTTMDVNYDIEDGSTFDGENQRATFELSSYNVQALASLDFPIVSVYGGVGYTAGTSDLKVLGTYEVDYTIGERTLTDPIDVSYDPSGVRATVGARLNLAFFKIFADYTVQEYNNITAGIAFSFR